MSRKNLLTRKKVNNHIIDSALNDIYDKLNSLLPVSIDDVINSTEEPQEGQAALVPNPNNGSSLAMYTNQGWKVDINSQFELADRRSFLSNRGMKGANRKLVPGESLFYDKSGRIEIGNKSGQKLIIKNDNNILKVRNAADTADGDIEVANIRDANGNVVVEVNAVAGTQTDHIKLTNSITSAYPLIEPGGSTANQSLQVKSKGTGKVYIQTTHANSYVGFQDNTDAVRLQMDPQNKKFKMLGQATKYVEMTTDTNGELVIANYDGDNDIVTTHIKLSACDDIYLAAGGNNIYLNGGGNQDDYTFDIGTTFGFFDFGTSTTCKLSSANNYDFHLIGMGTGDIKLDPGGGIVTIDGKALIDRNTSGDGAQDATGMHVDFDRTVASSGTAAHNDIGIDLDINSASLGISSVKGLDIDVVGATTGTHTATGIDLNLSGADVHHGLSITTPDNATGRRDIRIYSAGDAADYCTIYTSVSGATTIETVDGGAMAADLTLNIDGGLYIDADNGEARLQNGSGTFTPAHADDLVTKAYVDSVKHTAVWGGNLARIGGSGTWFGIPTGYSAAVLQMGTGSAPDTSYTVTSSADDLVACIWASMHDITVTGCKIWCGQGGGNNTAHSVSLMRYDIDGDGDLSNGVEVGAATAINNDDYSHARAQTLTLSGTAADLDIDFSNNEILIAFVEPTAAYNSAMGAKVILEYTEVAT